MNIINNIDFLIVLVCGVLLDCISGAENSSPVVRVPPDTNWCLGCICEVMTECDRSLKCEGDVCGLFKITPAYWIDAGKLTVNNENPKSQNAYYNCTVDAQCAGATVASYLKKFSQDCNGDGAIDCYDYATIHKFGGYGCSSRPLDNDFSTKLSSCIKHSEKLGASTKS